MTSCISKQQLHILPPKSSITKEHQDQNYLKVMVWFLLLFYLLGVAANQKKAVLRPDIKGSLQFEVSDISTAESLHKRQISVYSWRQKQKSETSF